MKFARKLLIVVLIIGAIRLLIPFVALRGINYVLSHKNEDYTGHLKGLELAILRGRIAFKNLHIEKRDKPQALQADVVYTVVNYSWSKLLNKNAVAEISVDGVSVVMTEIPKLKPPKPDELSFEKIRQILAESKWSSEISKIAVRNADVKFVVPEANLPLSVNNISVDVFNIHLSPAKNWQLAVLRVESYLQGQGRMLLTGQMQPLAKPVMADMNFSIVDFDLKTLNGLLLKVLPMDLTRGKFSSYVEAASEKGYTNGYVKLFFDDIDVVSNPQKLKSGRHFTIEAAAALGNWILKNNKEDSVALNLPFKIKHDDVTVNASDAFWSTLRNKRDELDRKFDNSVSFVQNRSESLLE